MAPSRSCFETLNLSHVESLPQDMDYFTLTAHPSTKVWREPGLTDTITAPMIYTALREPLVVAEVTVTANWRLEWDQAGLIIFIGSPPCVEDLYHYPHSRNNCRRWARAGVELSSGMLNVSSAAALSYSGTDVSLNPVSNLAFRDNPYPSTAPSVRVKIERIGDALWVWYHRPEDSESLAFRDPDEVSRNWRKVREIAGFFWGMTSKNAVWIGCYASRPLRWTSSTTIQGLAGHETNGLCVEFEDLEIV